MRARVRDPWRSYFSARKFRRSLFPSLLERSDVDKPNGVVQIRRVYVDGSIRLNGKQTRSLRTAPLPFRAAQAVDALPPRLDTRLLFAGARGGHLNLKHLRRDEWTPAVRAAGLAHRGPYALRHTFATFGIAAGVSLFELSRFMGTSVEQIDKTYGDSLPDALDRDAAGARHLPND